MGGTWGFGVGGSSLLAASRGMCFEPLALNPDFTLVTGRPFSSGNRNGCAFSPMWVSLVSLALLGAPGASVPELRRTVRVGLSLSVSLATTFCSFPQGATAGLGSE